MGRAAGHHLERWPGLARLPGRDVPACLVQGLLGQGGLPRGAPRPAGDAGATVRRGLLPVHQRLPGQRAGTRPQRQAISSAEIGRWAEQAERLGRSLAGSALRARHATSEEIAWLFRHTLAQTMGDPPPSAVRRRTWGTGEIEALAEGQVHNGRTLLHLERPEGESWVA